MLICKDGESSRIRGVSRQGVAMTDTKLEITRQQQEILLRGLRFVRSAVALDVQEPSDDVIDNRTRQYAEIRELESMLNTAPLIETTNA